MTAEYAFTVHGGLSRRRSRASIRPGAAWNPKSGRKSSWNSGGKTRDLSIAQRPQYKTVMRISRGAEKTDSAFLMLKRVGESVMSANSPTTKVIRARDKPMMVRN